MKFLLATVKTSVVHPKPDPDPLVRGTDPDPDPSPFLINVLSGLKQCLQNKILTQNFNQKFHHESQ
jgi:hypothetical protein